MHAGQNNLPLHDINWIAGTADPDVCTVLMAPVKSLWCSARVEDTRFDVFRM